ncbi:MAG: hypothetical protein PHF29_00860 [Candidatus Riflebacteria bacterium]|nr:hypothetical protein [Candidatus Riflebacteria bacterium]
MLTNATIVMIIGMIIVYLFLFIMIGLMNLISFVLSYFPEKKLAVADGGSSELEEIAAAIAIAKKKV